MMTKQSDEALERHALRMFIKVDLIIAGILTTILCGAPILAIAVWIYRHLLAILP